MILYRANEITKEVATMMRAWKLGFIGICILCISASGDEVRTKDGSVILGEVVSLTEGKLKFKTTFAGEIEIPWDQVIQILTEKPLPVHMGEEGILNATLRSPEPGQVEVVSASEVVTGTIDLTRITGINPPPPPPVAWHGSIVAAYSKTTGNTENMTGLLKADAKRRTEKDRLTFGALWRYREEEGELAERNTSFLGKYDFFVSEKLYTYGNLRLDNDKFKDLRLRTSVGGGLGYQFVETKRADFSAETGLSYVHESYYEADDEDFVAWRAAYAFDYWLIQDLLRFLHNLEWLQSLDETDDWLVNTDATLRLKISDRWSANGSVIYTYDNVVPPGTEKEDVIYALGLAYEF